MREFKFKPMLGNFFGSITPIEGNLDKDLWEGVG